MSHSPGPWNLLCLEARGRPRCLVVDAKDNEIASVNPFRESWNEDAELIAAAPDLLEALQRIVSHQDYIGGSMATMSPIRYIAMRAIEKATGTDAAQTSARGE